LRGEGRLRAAPERGQHLAGLVGVVVDGLLAEDHQVRLFLLHQLEQGARGRERLHVLAGLHDHVDGAVGAHGQAVAQVRLGVGRGDGGDHHLCRDALVAQAQGLLEGDLVEGVGRQLHAVGDHAGTVRPDLDADVGVHHALVGDQDLHRWGLPSRNTAAGSGWTPNSSESRGWPACPSAILPPSVRGQEVWMLHPVILSGGSGSRLWPLSRHYLPKQFLALMGDRSLFQATVQRADRLPEAAPPVVVCSDVHRFLVGEQLQEIGVSDAAILVEPVARNTAPAIAVAALHLAARNPGATMLVLPADHLIEDEAAFQQAVARAMALAADGWLVTFGIRPDSPETGYGYIRRGDSLGEAAYSVGEFVEKPDLATAQGYLAAGDYSWNS